MKHRLLPVLVIVLLFASLLAACGSSAPATSDTTAPSPSAATDAGVDEASPSAEPSAAASTAVEASTEAATSTGAAAETVSNGGTQLKLWTHSAGSETEYGAITQMIADFNASQSDYQVVAEAFPQATYNDSVAAASVAGNLPCILDLDQPTVANFAWSKYVSPLPVTEEQLAALTPAAVGTYKDQVYSLGQFDVALLIYGRKSILEENNIRIPTLEQPWTRDEFMQALDTLKATGDFEYPIDVNAQSTGEWWAYAYSPMLQSFGGDLIDRDSMTTAEGVLNGPESVAWGEWFQGLFENGYANPKPADDQAFLQGRVPLWYTGSWSANDVVKAYGDDALFLPTVDFGNGPKIGGASWQWGISESCAEKDGAWQFIDYVMQPEQIALMSTATGLVPTSEAGAALTENYKEGGPYRIFFDMAKDYAVLRPATPGYLTISSQFEKAGLQIRDGGDVQNALDDAVDAIDRNIEDNNNFGF